MVSLDVGSIGWITKENNIGRVERAAVRVIECSLCLLPRYFLAPNYLPTLLRHIY